MQSMLDVTASKAIMVVCTEPNLPLICVQNLKLSCHVLSRVCETCQDLALPCCNIDIVLTEWCDLPAA